MRRKIARWLRSGCLGAVLRIAVFCLSVAGFSAASHAADRCTLERLIETPMLQDEYFSPIIQITMNDKPAKVLLDTGGFWSLTSSAMAAGLPVRISQVTGALDLQGIPLDRVVTLPSVQIGIAKFNKVDFFIAPPAYVEKVDGTLGANWLANFDVEIDPVKNTVSLFSHDHCDGQVAYWPHNDLAIVPFTLVRGERHVKLTLNLAGKDVRVMIDTGAPDSALSMRAAKRLFDLTPDSPGMELTDTEKDATGHVRKYYRYQFSTLDMGGIAFKNPRITIADFADDNDDMILGMRQLHGLHLFFAYGEKKLYATSARGDIAAAGGAAAGQSDPLARVNATTFREDALVKLDKGDKDGALAAIEQGLTLDPNYSEGFRARADIHAARGERELALKDYAHALEIDPANLEAYADQSQFEWMVGNKTQAMSDIGLALGRDPGFIRGYKLRAGFETSNHDWNGALADAGQLIRARPNSEEGYAFRAQLYAASGDYAHAYEDQTVAVKLAPKSAAALNNKCWFGAILGKLDDALEDCDSALDIAPKDAAALDSRGFVRLRKGQWDRAIRDYSAALDAKPNMASSLYGRGQAKQQKGDKPGADADIAAAEKIDKTIAQHFGK